MTRARTRPFDRRASISVPAGACAASRSSVPSSTRLTTAKPRPSVASGLTASSVREASASRLFAAPRAARHGGRKALAQRRRLGAQRLEPVPRILAPQPRAQVLEPLLPPEHVGAQRQSQALFQVVESLRVLREPRAGVRDLQPLQ